MQTDIAGIVARHRGREGALLPVLHDLMESLGCVPDRAVPLITEMLNRSRAEVHGAISFYHDFRPRPAVKPVVYMANQIEREFANQHPSTAAQATYDHLWHFRDPRMRSLMLEHEARGGAGITDVAREALAMLRRSIAEPRSITKATQLNQAPDPDADLDPMSDAG